MIKTNLMTTLRTIVAIAALAGLTSTSNGELTGWWPLDGGRLRILVAKSQIIWDRDSQIV